MYKRYLMVRDRAGRCHATVERRRGEGAPLDYATRLRNHSPDGYNWGYGGSGPAQLALAILADAIADNDAVLRYYQDFKWEVIAKQQDDVWALDVTDVLHWLADRMLRDSEQSAVGDDQAVTDADSGIDLGNMGG